MLGDEAIQLSGSQKQLVALARALLHDDYQLVFYGATSDLDSNLEWKLQAAIETIDRDYAMVAIVHQHSTVENADRIYTMKDGEVVEGGNHSEWVS